MPQPPPALLICDGASVRSVGVRFRTAQPRSQQQREKGDQRGAHRGQRPPKPCPEGDRESEGQHDLTRERQIDRVEPHPAGAGQPALREGMLQSAVGDPRDQPDGGKGRGEDDHFRHVPASSRGRLGPRHELGALLDLPGDQRCADERADDGQSEGTPSSNAGIAKLNVVAKATWRPFGYRCMSAWQLACTVKLPR